MTVEIRENMDLHREAEAELFCPFCGTHSIRTVVNHGTLKMNCTNCGMNSFVTRLPRGKKT
jgi:ribosomal protein L44E